VWQLAPISSRGVPLNDAAQILPPPFPVRRSLRGQLLKRDTLAARAQSLPFDALANPDNSVTRPNLRHSPTPPRRRGDGIHDRFFKLGTRSRLP